MERLIQGVMHWGMKQVPADISHNCNTWGRPRGVKLRPESVLTVEPRLQRKKQPLRHIPSKERYYFSFQFDYKYACYVQIVVSFPRMILFAIFCNVCVIGTSALYNRYSLLNLFASINNCQYFKAFMRCECSCRRLFSVENICRKKGCLYICTELPTQQKT